MTTKPKPSTTGDPYDWVSDSEECGSPAPRTLTDERGREWEFGDCSCTLDASHDGDCYCQPCTERFGAPGWTPKNTEATT